MATDREENYVLLSTIIASILSPIFVLELIGDFSPDFYILALFTGLLVWFGCIFTSLALADFFDSGERRLEEKIEEKVKENIMEETNDD